MRVRRGLGGSGWSAVAALGLALALPAAAGAPAAHAAFPGANGRIAFSSFSSIGMEGSETVTEHHSIDVASPSGGGRRSLRGCTRVMSESGGPFAPIRGDCSIDYLSPAWSARGTRLVFDAGARLALMKSDGTGFRLLEQQTAADGEPAWSPDERRLVFSGASTVGGQTDLYLLDLPSGGLTQLTTRGGRSPAWSSGGRIAFTRGGNPLRAGSGDIYTIRPDGSRLRRITHHGGSNPTWSPHGSMLAFIRARGSGSSLYVIRPDGRGLRRLVTPGADSPAGPTWSPDGRQIAYTGFDGCLSAQRLNGRAVRQVAGCGVNGNSSIGTNSPDWQPLPRR